MVLVHKFLSRNRFSFGANRANSQLPSIFRWCAYACGPLPRARYFGGDFGVFFFIISDSDSDRDCPSTATNAWEKRVLRGNGASNCEGPADTGKSVLFTEA